MSIKGVKPELLSPAGDLEKLKAAVIYGADAVYMGGKSLGLRAKAKNFHWEEMREGIDFAHKNNVKVYVTANIFAHEEDFQGIEEYLVQIGRLGVDALIISDPGIFSVARKTLPHLDLHISTQANNTNYLSSLFWRDAGARRVVLARELSMGEVGEICAKIQETDPSFEFEVFVHGAMCISYSGRCLLSNYMVGRDSNRGACAHPCRWKYHLSEEKRPGEYYPVYEDERGTYIFNSKDLCMAAYLPQILESGVSSLKIEGRMKSPYYVAVVTKVYREAIDDYFSDPKLYSSKINYYMEELEKASHRGFTTGFYFNKPESGDHVYSESSYIRNYDFLGVVTSVDKEKGRAFVEQRNKFSLGDEIEILSPKGPSIPHVIKEIYDDKGEAVSDAPHPKQKVSINLPPGAECFSMLRKVSKEGNCED